MRRWLASLTITLSLVLSTVGVSLPAAEATVPAAAAVQPASSRGGSWNMERDRNRVAAAHQALQLMDRYHLDWLLLQESGDYRTELAKLPGTRLIASVAERGQYNTSILLRDRVASGPGYQVRMTRAGWVTVRGGHTAAKWMTTVLVDGWLRLGSLHLAPSVTWRHRHMHGPHRRVVSYRDHAKAVVRWFCRHPAMPTILAGDWNATPAARGAYAPHWQARRSGAGAWVKAPRAATHGHHRTIDYGLTRWLRVRTAVHRAWGDHKLVVYAVTDNR